MFPVFATDLQYLKIFMSSLCKKNANEWRTQMQTMKILSSPTKSKKVQNRSRTIKQKSENTVGINTGKRVTKSKEKQTKYTREGRLIREKVILIRVITKDGKSTMTGSDKQNTTHGVKPFFSPFFYVFYSL